MSAARLRRVERVGEALTLAQPVELGAGGTSRVAVCVEHCVLLPPSGAFISGWLFDPEGDLEAAWIEDGDSATTSRITPTLQRPDVLLERKVAWDEHDEASLRSGFCELVRRAQNRPPPRDGLRLVCDLGYRGRATFPLPVAETTDAVLAFIRAVGLHSVATELPVRSDALSEPWRSALMRLSWLAPRGSVEASQLAAYLERGEPLETAALAAAVESMSPEAMLPSADLVRRLRRSGLFDDRHYRDANRDVAASGVDPLTHYLAVGHRQGRDPSPTFSTTYYRVKHLRGDMRVNPLVHFFESGGRADVPTRPGPHDLEDDVFAQVRHWSNPGELAEDFDPSIARGRARRAKVFAFYLPQFHPIPENDRWWGPGFTEWRNLMRGVPRFVGHYQPRIPRDLGFYELGDPSVIERQAALARSAGIHGFCFHYYRFGAKRILERPVDQFLADPAVDLPFCLIWANENWTRRWDGRDDEVLLRQEHDPSADEGLVDDIQRHFEDPRYLRIGGRPVLLVYRFDIIRSPRRRVARWRALWQRRHGEEPLILLAQTFDAVDPRRYGADGAIEFPPHNIARHVPSINDSVRILDATFNGDIYDYDTIATLAARRPAPGYPLVKGVIPAWDNDARRQGAGVVLTGSSPASYERWLRAAIDAAERNPCFGERLVFVNAWNEWAEAAYLEPDVHFGAAYLNATARAVCGSPA